MFWLLFWLLSLFLFLVFPIVCVEENRRRWIRRFRRCRWDVDDQVIPSDNQERVANGQGFHYVLSKAQEDEIRESFLHEKLKDFTKELTEEHIDRPRRDSRQDPSHVVANVDVEKATTTESGERCSDDVEADSDPSEDLKATEPVTSENDVPDDFSDGGSSDDEVLNVVAFTGEDEGKVSVPLAGKCLDDANHAKDGEGCYRKEPNGCAICLCAFEVADKVCWSSNPDCQHIYHDSCIENWLMTSGRKHLKRQRREQRRSGNLAYDSDPIAKITGFPMLCPICRQFFIMPEPEEEESVDEKEGNREIVHGAHGNGIATTRIPLTISNAV